MDAQAEFLCHTRDLLKWRESTARSEPSLYSL